MSTIPIMIVINWGKAPIEDEHKSDYQICICQMGIGTDKIKRKFCSRYS